MTFKLEITTVKENGEKTNIKLENSEALQNQSDLFNLLRPLISNQQQEPVFIDIEGPTIAPLMRTELKKETLDVEAAAEKAAAKMEFDKKEFINRIKQPTPEKIVVKKVSERETGVAQIHCPNCGLQTAKHTPVKNSYIPCTTCSTKLFLYALNDVRGEPNELGVSFKANSVYMTAEERWKERNG